MKPPKKPFSSQFQQFYGDFVNSFDLYVYLFVPLKKINGFSWQERKIMYSVFKILQQQQPT